VGVASRHAATLLDVRSRDAAAMPAEFTGGFHHIFRRALVARRDSFALLHRHLIQLRPRRLAPPPFPRMHYQSHTNPPRSAGHGLDDDYVLMEGIARRDPSALSRLFDRHSVVVHTLCLRILKDPGLAEDAVIDVFHEVWQRSERYNAARGTPIAYLLTLTRSRALDRARMKGAHPTASLHDNGDANGRADAALDPLQSALEDERRSFVRSALEKLDPKYQEVMECSFFEGLSHTEIALKLQKPVGTVKTYLRRGLIQLRDILRSADDGNLAP
jgi:RNA polymerase sigma-70 factor (ECF subfamily)